jgi:CubicO group peptidase (beta-lactamase class C family)
MALLLLPVGLLIVQPQGGTSFAGMAGQYAQQDLAQIVADTIEEWLPSQLSENGVPGAAVAVVTGESVLWREIYGHLEDSESPAVDTETLFCIRSISKSITALAVLMAVQDGLVDLDRPISDYLPEFTVNSRFDEQPEKSITLRHMLGHWAGFTHDPPPMRHANGGDLFERYIHKISESWLRFPVGYRWAYSNYGYDLAAYILQVRSGQPFPEYAKEKVLLPLGMTASTFDMDIIERAANRAVGHKKGADSVRLRFPEVAAAGLYSNIRDMGRYAQFHINGGMVDGTLILRPDLMEVFHGIQFPHAGQRTGFAMGLIREVTGSTYSLYHAGGGRGFRCLLIVYPELDYGVVLLTNSNDHALTELPGRIVMNGPVLERLGRNAVAEPTGRGLEPLDPEDPRVESIIGRYGDQYGSTIGYHDGALGIWAGSPRQFYPMTMYSVDGELIGAYGRFSEIRFLSPVEGQPRTFTVSHRRYSNGNSFYQAINEAPGDPPGPNEPHWQQYVGSYAVYWETELVETVDVSVRHGYLYVGERKCREHERGLFFTNDGQALDFRSTPPVWANLRLVRRDDESAR